MASRPFRGTAGRVAVILLGIVTLLSIAGAGGALFFQMQERAIRLTREKELRLVKAENAQLQEQLSEVTNTKERVEGELTQAKVDLEQTAQQLAKEQKAKEEFAKAVDQRQQEIDRLSKDLEQVRADRTQLTQRITQLTKQQETLETQLDQMESAKAELEEKVVEFSQSQPTVELEPVVVTDAVAADAVASVGGTQGQVVVVNREYDFVVMNLGKNHGLTLGQEFQVIRDNQVLGRVKVEKIYDELSAAAILPQSKQGSIQEGDSVRAAL